jgi:hypothetical protein
MAVGDITTITAMDGMAAVAMAVIAGPPIATTTAATTIIATVAGDMADPTGETMTSTDAMVIAMTAGNGGDDFPAAHFSPDRRRPAMCRR